MSWSLRNYRVSDLIIVDFTIYTFNHDSKHPNLREYKMERFRLLNQTQSHAVCRFLRYLANHGDYVDSRMANVALGKFWGRFCETIV
jgi:hypothetical protein